MQIDLIAGARPNFMKIAPIIEAIEKAKNEGKDIDYRLVHTGQHYDARMSGDSKDCLKNELHPILNLTIDWGYSVCGLLKQSDFVK